MILANSFSFGAPTPLAQSTVTAGSRWRPLCGAPNGQITFRCLPRRDPRTHRELGVGRREFAVVPFDGRLPVRHGFLGRVVAPDEVMQLRRRDESGVEEVEFRLGRRVARRLRAERARVEPVGEGADQRSARRAGIVAVDDVGGLGQVGSGFADEGLQGREEFFVRLGVGELGREGFPGGVEHLAHRVDEFHAVVLRGHKGGQSGWSRGAKGFGGERDANVFWVVASGDHDADAFAVQVLAAEDGEEAYAEHDRVEEVGTNGGGGGSVPRQRVAPSKGVRWDVLCAESCSSVGVVCGLQFGMVLARRP